VSELCKNRVLSTFVQTTQIIDRRRLQTLEHSQNCETLRNCEKSVERIRLLLTVNCGSNLNGPATFQAGGRLETQRSKDSHFLRPSLARTSQFKCKLYDSTDAICGGRKADWNSK
jgi:hypothetical protein